MKKGWTAFEGWTDGEGIGCDLPAARLERDGKPQLTLVFPTARQKKLLARIVRLLNAADS